MLMMYLRMYTVRVRVRVLSIMHTCIAYLCINFWISFYHQNVIKALNVVGWIDNNYYIDDKIYCTYLVAIGGHLLFTYTLLYV